MKTLGHKLYRDLWRLRYQCATIALLVGCGIASFVAAVVNDFYDWPKVAGKIRVAHGGASTSGGAQPAENFKDQHWRSGFVWNVEQNGEGE